MQTKVGGCPFDSGGDSVLLISPYLTNSCVVQVIVATKQQTAARAIKIAVLSA